MKPDLPPRVRLPSTDFGPTHGKPSLQGSGLSTPALMAGLDHPFALGEDFAMVCGHSPSLFYVLSCVFNGFVCSGVPERRCLYAFHWPKSVQLYPQHVCNASVHPRNTLVIHVSHEFHDTICSRYTRADDGSGTTSATERHQSGHRQPQRLPVAVLVQFACSTRWICNTCVTINVAVLRRRVAVLFRRPFPVSHL